jgi:hypothetical protein
MEGEGLLCYIMRAFVLFATEGFNINSPFLRWSFTGNGTTQSYNLPDAFGLLPNSYLVYIDGVVQDPVNFTISNTNPIAINFSTAIPNGSVVTIISLGGATPSTDVTDYTATPDGSSTSNTIGYWLAQTGFNKSTKFSTLSDTNTYSLEERFYKSKTIYLAPRTDGIAGDGTIINPFDVSTPAKWKSVFLAIPSYSTVRLLSGQYNIQHSTYVDAPYYPSGISIIGDGIGKTIITGTLAPSTNINSDWYLISIDGRRDGNDGDPYITMPRQKSCVVSDLTVDCNWQNLRIINSKCQAINISGTENNSIKRCRVINFGGDGSLGRECFPVVCEGDNAIVEECVIEQPVSGVGETEAYATYVLVGGGLATWQQDLRAISSDATNNTISQQQKYVANDVFVFRTLVGGNPFIVGKTYFVVNPTNNGYTFQLSATIGGAAINFDTITSATGGGLQTANKCIVKNNILRGQSASTRDGFGIILGSGFSTLIVEGNTFENMSQACYGDSWTGGTAIIRNNFFKNNRTNIRALITILSARPFLNELNISNNVFYGYGINGSGLSGNENFIGGWAVRTTNVNYVKFTDNIIKSVDGLPINEVLFFGPTKLTYTNNIIDANCSIANQPSETSSTVENNTDERGIQRFEFANWSQSLTVKCNTSPKITFSADAATNTITVLYVYRMFEENDFVYVYELTGGSGLSVNTRYYVRNLVTAQDNQNTYSQTFQLYTEKTGGTLVDITANYTSVQNKISNREYKNGVALTRGCNFGKYAIYNGLYDFLTTRVNSEKTFTVFVEPGTYEFETEDVTKQLPPGWKIVGLGRNNDVILRCWKQSSMCFADGSASGVSVINLTLTAWGVGGTAMLSGGTGNYFEDVIFAMGAGAIKCFGPGSFGVGNQTTMVRCSSDAVCWNIDNLGDQGTATNGLYVDCNFSNGFPPNVSGSILRNCNLKVNNLGFRNNGGILQNSRIELLGAYALNAFDLYNGVKCENSIIEGLRVRVGGTSPTINNTTINTSDPTNSIMQTDGATTVNIFNVGANRPIGAGVTKATPLTAL